jgi:hypothetical protein
MLGCCGLLGTMCVVGYRFFDVIHWQNDVATVMLLTLLAEIPVVFWHTLPRPDKRDAALTLPWVVAILVLFEWAVLISASFDLPLRDHVYLAIDQSLGINVAKVLAWSSRHTIMTALLRFSYYRLFLLLFYAAIFAPPIIGMKAYAERFLLGNTFSILLSLPISALFPAVGPWVAYGFAPKDGQRVVELSIAALRGGHQPIVSGIVCFPSFHVIWAISSAAALWWLKPLRVPIAVMASLVVVSTVTTGWHYVCDVIAGLIVVAVSLVFAEWFRRRYLEGNEEQSFALLEMKNG